MADDTNDAFAPVPAMTEAQREQFDAQLTAKAEYNQSAKRYWNNRAESGEITEDERVSALNDALKFKADPETLKNETARMNASSKDMEERFYKDPFGTPEESKQFVDKLEHRYEKLDKDYSKAERAYIENAERVAAKEAEKQGMTKEESRDHRYKAYEKASEYCRDNGPQYTDTYEQGVEKLNNLKALNAKNDALNKAQEAPAAAPTPVKETPAPAKPETPTAPAVAPIIGLTKYTPRPDVPTKGDNIDPGFHPNMPDGPKNGTPKFSPSMPTTDGFPVLTRDQLEKAGEALRRGAAPDATVGHSGFTSVPLDEKMAAAYERVEGAVAQQPIFGPGLSPEGIAATNIVTNPVAGNLIQRGAEILTAENPLEAAKAAAINIISEATFRMVGSDLLRTGPLDGSIIPPQQGSPTASASVAEPETPRDTLRDAYIASVMNERRLTALETGAAHHITEDFHAAQAQADKMLKAFEQGVEKSGQPLNDAAYKNETAVVTANTQRLYNKEVAPLAEKREAEFEAAKAERAAAAAPAAEAEKNDPFATPIPAKETPAADKAVPAEAAQPPIFGPGLSPEGIAATNIVTNPVAGNLIQRGAQILTAENPLEAAKAAAINIISEIAIPFPNGPLKGAPQRWQQDINEANRKSLDPEGKPAPKSETPDSRATSANALPPAATKEDLARYTPKEGSPVTRVKMNENGAYEITYSDKFDYGVTTIDPKNDNRYVAIVNGEVEIQLGNPEAPKHGVLVADPAKTETAAASGKVTADAKDVVANGKITPRTISAKGSTGHGQDTAAAVATNFKEVGTKSGKSLQLQVASLTPQDAARNKSADAAGGKGIGQAAGIQ